MSRFVGKLRQNEPIGQFRAKVLNGMREKAEALQFDHELAQREELLDVAWEEDPNILSQLYGLYRIAKV